MFSYVILLLAIYITASFASTDGPLVSLPRPTRHRRPSRPSSSLYLTETTKRFAVDGTQLPFTNFEIGETYAGLLPIDHEDEEYFFWFAPSTNADASDEILIWLNGGPGASSLNGFLHANGNFIWQPGGHAPVPNTWAWSNLTNVVWVDQPLGTGYSNGQPNIRSQDDAAKFFLAFWKHFIDTFNLHDKKVYIAGESYAGKWVPYLAEGMINQLDPRYYNVSGILLFNPGIGDGVVQSEILLADFAAHNAATLSLNSSFVHHIKSRSANCGFDTYSWFNWRFPPTGQFPYPPSLSEDHKLAAGCDIFIPVFEAARKANPCFNLYQISQKCPIPFDPLGFPYTGHYLPPTFPRPYFDLTTVKSALHVPWNYTWTITSHSPVFISGRDQSPPSTFAFVTKQSPLQTVIEHTSNVIIANGDLDMAVPTNGTLFALQNLTWNGAQGFSTPPVHELWVPKADEYIQECIAGSGVMGSWMEERGLTFARVFQAGHQVAEWTPSVAYRQVEVLLGRVMDMAERRGFSTQPYFAAWDNT